MKEVLYTSERWENVNATNKELLKLYLRSKVTDRSRPNTLREYGYDLKFFLVWNYVYNNNMSVLEFKKRHFEDFKFFMINDRECSNARVNRVMCVIRNMMGYAEDDDDEYEEYMRNIAAKVKTLDKKPKKEITFVTEKQVVLLREYLRSIENYKYMFLLDLLYDSGARINEILQVDNTATADRGFIKVECKGGQMEYILLHDRAKESLKLHMQNLKGSDIWVSDKGIKIKNTDTLRVWVKNMYLMLKGIDKNTPYFTPHSFRHSMIENMENGTHYLCEQLGRPFTTEEIAALVHHKSIDMTKSYMKPKEDKLIMNLFGIRLD